MHVRTSGASQAGGEGRGGKNRSPCRLAAGTRALGGHVTKVRTALTTPRPEQSFFFTGQLCGLVVECTSSSSSTFLQGTTARGSHSPASLNSLPSSLAERHRASQDGRGYRGSCARSLHWVRLQSTHSLRYPFPGCRAPWTVLTLRRPPSLPPSPTSRLTCLFRRFVPSDPRLSIIRSAAVRCAVHVLAAGR